MTDDDICRDVIKDLIEKRFITEDDKQEIYERLLILRGQMEATLGQSDTVIEVAIPLIQDEEMEGGHSGGACLWKDPFTGRLFILKKIKEGAVKVESVRNKLARLVNENVSEWHGTGTIDENYPQSFECSAFVVGTDLKKILENWRGQPEFGAKVRLRILLDIIDGALALHKVGLFHRDLKPANTIVSPPDKRGGRRAKVIDHGLVTDINDYKTRKLQTALTAGTPRFMPPYILCVSQSDISDNNEDLTAMLAGGDGYAIGQIAIELFGGLFQLIDGDGKLIEEGDSLGSYRQALSYAWVNEGQCRVLLKDTPPWARYGKESSKDTWGGKVRLMHRFKKSRFTPENLTEVIQGLMDFDPDKAMPLLEAKKRAQEMLDSLK